MVRKTRTHLSGPTPGAVQPKLAPKHLTKQEFGRRLYQLMMSKGWRQSELARRADMPRDNVSNYVRGLRVPTPDSVRKLAKALGVEAEELYPNLIESAIDADNPAFEMKVSPNAPGKAWLRINRMVSTTTAVKIAEIIEADDRADQ